MDWKFSSVEDWGIDVAWSSFKFWLGICFKRWHQHLVGVREILSQPEAKGRQKVKPTLKATLLPSIFTLSWYSSAVCSSQFLPRSMPHFLFSLTHESSSIPILPWILESQGQKRTQACLAQTSIQCINSAGHISQNIFQFLLEISLKKKFTTSGGSPFHCKGFKEF